MKKVVIVGGGTAGWITACYLNARLNQHKNGERIHITLIEPHLPERIGVGEATIPTLLKTLQVLGIKEREFMAQTGATFKQGIKFINWKTPNSHYFHVFDRRPSGAADMAGLIWSSGAQNRSFAESVSAQPEFCEAGLSPKALGQPDFESPMAYAYHLDAEKFAELLARKALAGGVERKTGKVQNARQDDRGNIVSVELEDGGSVAADLFIDCSGFSARLIGQALNVDFIDYSQWLLCDSAVTMQVPYNIKAPERSESRARREPYTQSTALSSGWVWDIPLRERRGVGYVYGSDFLSQEQAVAELKAFEGPHSQEIECRHLRFRTGRRKVSWKNNCVAIGLSSGFLEPLESTGIFLVEFAAAMLCEYFPYTSEMTPIAEKFNATLNQRYDEILDFIALHYCLTQRTDTAFWREVGKAERIPPGLSRLLKLWSTKPCSISDFHDASQVFGHMNYEYILYGMGFQYPFARDAATNLPPVSPRERYVAKEKALGLQKLPGHDEWLVKELGAFYGLNY